VPPSGIRHDVAAELKRLPNVTLRLAPGEISDVLDGAAALIVPSQLDEPFGRVAFEGLAAGVPTLASDAGGLRETVPPAQRVAPRDDPGAWAMAIRKLEDPLLWQGARDAGVAAAGRVVAGRSLERIEDGLMAAARGQRAAAA
jgi:D-inositol-3-phosphate glycosyltransferase